MSKFQKDLAVTLMAFTISALTACAYFKGMTTSAAFYASEFLDYVIFAVFHLNS